MKMKDFAKSIVCNTKAENIATDITTDGNTWFVTTSDGKKKEFPSEREAEEYVKKIKAGNKKAGNSRVGNKEWKPGDIGKVEIARIPYKVKIISVDGPWAKIQFLEGDMKGMTDSELVSAIGNIKVGNGLSDSYEFLMSAGKNDYNSIKEEVKKAGGWTPEIKAKARKTSDTLKKKAKELVETAHKQSAELERLAGDIESI